MKEPTNTDLMIKITQVCENMNGFRELAANEFEYLKEKVTKIEEHQVWQNGKLEKHERFVNWWIGFYKGTGIIITLVGAIGGAFWFLYEVHNIL